MQEIYNPSLGDWLVRIYIHLIAKKKQNLCFMTKSKTQLFNHSSTEKSS
jgi:hypothetical protein